MTPVLIALLIIVVVVILTLKVLRSRNQPGAFAPADADGLTQPFPDVKIRFALAGWTPLSTKDDDVRGYSHFASRAILRLKAMPGSSSSGRDSREALVLDLVKKIQTAYSEVVTPASLVAHDAGAKDVVRGVTGGLRVGKPETSWVHLHNTGVVVQTVVTIEGDGGSAVREAGERVALSSVGPGGGDEGAEHEFPFDTGLEPDESGTFRVFTNGLPLSGRRDLEMVKVPALWVAAAGAILTKAADYTIKQKALGDGELYVMQFLGFGVVVKLFETGDGRNVLRLSDPEASSVPSGPPFAALATIGLIHGLGNLEKDREKSLASWKTSIELFPGTPASATRPEVVGRGYNTENFLTYLALAEHTQDGDAERFYALALERSSLAFETVAGVAALPDVPPEQLKREAAELIIAAQLGLGPSKAEVLRKAMEKVGAQGVLSPLVTTREGGGYQRVISLLPVGARDTFSQSPVREQIRGNDELSAVAEIYQAMRTEPAKVLAKALRTREWYLARLGPKEFSLEAGTPTMGVPLEGLVAPHTPVLSLIVADVGRLLAAEMDLKEIRAHYGLSDDTHAQQSATIKLSDFEAKEMAGIPG